MSNMRKLRRVVIKEELVALTGDPIEALILNQFIYWTEHMYGYDKYILEEKKRYENEGQELNIQLTHGWIYKRAEDIADEIMFPMSKPTARKHMANLIEKGYLSERDNPSLRWDKTKQYRVNMKKVYNDLTAMGYPFDGWTIDEKTKTEDSEPAEEGHSNNDKISGTAEGKNEYISKLKKLTSEKPALASINTSKTPENPKLKILTSEEENFPSELNNLTAIPEIKHKDYSQDYTTTTAVVVAEKSNLASDIAIIAKEEGKNQAISGESGVETKPDKLASKLKKDIDAATGGSIAPDAVRRLLVSCGEEQIQHYITNFDKFRQSHDINNAVGFFIKAVEERYPLPVSSAKKNQWNNFEQRDNDFQSIEKAIQERNRQRFSLWKDKIPRLDL
jgi:hypothetical protein